MIPVILVVDDDASIAELVRYNLLRAGYRVLTAAGGRAAQTTLESTPVDLVVLDLMLPDLSGFDLCRWFRRHSRAPVMILTARYDEADRVRAHLRRWSWQSAGPDDPAEKITIGPLTLDLAGRRAYCRSAQLHLTPMEFEILRVLSRAPGRVIPRERLLALASGQDVVGSARTVDVHVRSLRRKLEENPATPTFLETVRGAGYCLGRSLQA